MRRRRDVQAPDAAARSDEAREWLDAARVILFPTTAERDAEGRSTASTPAGREMLKARGELASLRKRRQHAGIDPVVIVTEARALLTGHGLLEKVEQFAAMPKPWRRAN